MCVWARWHARVCTLRTRPLPGDPLVGKRDSHETLIDPPEILRSFVNGRRASRRLTTAHVRARWGSRTGCATRASLPRHEKIWAWGAGGVGASTPSWGQNGAAPVRGRSSTMCQREPSKTQEAPAGGTALQRTCSRSAPGRRLATRSTQQFASGTCEVGARLSACVRHVGQSRCAHFFFSRSALITARREIMVRGTFPFNPHVQNSRPRTQKAFHVISSSTT